ncbi:MAG TPA: hypothetical protein VFF72_06380 [Caldimonas sp.]|nr:hypothetical protein [Caldimonas sp.]
MISRLTASAAVFAILAAATLTFAADVQQQRHVAARAVDVTVSPDFVQLPPVLVIGHRHH